MKAKRILILCYGNPGRQDDGLAPAAAKVIECWGLPGVTVEANYLLNIEDAADIVEHERVIFIDAAAQGPEPFEWRNVEPAGSMAFTSHLVPPGTLLAICEQCYGRAPPAWVLAIRGYEFELIEALTEKATANLEAALTFLQSELAETRVR